MPVKETVFVCEVCGREFCMLYDTKRTKKFCSRGCQSEALRRSPNLPEKVHKFQTREQFVAAASEVIKSKDRYVSVNDIGRVLHVCSNEFQRHGVDIRELNKQLGYSKPVSIGTEIVKKYLSQFIADLISEVTFTDFKSPKGMVLRYDLGSEAANLLVEVDGAMHLRGHSWNSEYRNMCSRMKDEYAKKNGIHFVRVPVVRDEDVTDAYLAPFFAPFLGNQKPEAAGMPSNGSETDSSSRPEEVCGGEIRNTARRWENLIRKV